MWSYAPPLRDMRFVIEELLEVRRDWTDIPRFAALDETTTPQVLDEAARFATHILAPLNAAADSQGCRLQDGSVFAPDGFISAYRRYCAAGWPGLACDADLGGQELPQLLNAALYEMLNAVNHAWAMYPGIAHGAYQCLQAHATDALKSSYLPQIVSGEWLITMCLTESQAGSDVGLIRTRAVAQADDTYRITGSKIFISGGEHDLTDNIVHLVLARLPEAPSGTRGVSLFLVPKEIVQNNGSRVRNGVRCDGIEKKMGINGSATCLMTFSDAVGWLIGAPNRGLVAMFVMMNSARLSVGLQGLGHAEMAYQNALRHANERLQMRAIVSPDSGPKGASCSAHPIAWQPAVRRNLLTMRAVVEGERALAYWAAHLLDVAEHHPDVERRKSAHDLASLLTPIVKAFLTEKGFELSSRALQVFGGYGYLRDTGVEQTVRDARIAMIYEGTNEVQAIDLLCRKVINDGGRKLAALLQIIAQEVSECASTEGCESFAESLRTVLEAVQIQTARIIEEAEADPELGNRIADDYLRLMGMLLLGMLWGRAARIATARVVERFYRNKLETARFYFDYLMPEATFRLELLKRRNCPLPWAVIDA